MIQGQACCCSQGLTGCQGYGSASANAKPAAKSQHHRELKSWRPTLGDDTGKWTNPQMAASRHKAATNQQHHAAIKLACLGL